MKQQILMSPILKEITLSVLKSIQYKKFPQTIPKINAELVPKVSKHVRERMMGSGKVGGISELKKPIRFRTRPPAQTRVMPMPKNYQPILRFNFKIEQLLKDPTIEIIDCPGADKQLNITRRGIKQRTKIILTKDEIKQFLEKIAQEARVPLIEGVFRAAVDNFIINAVVSDEIGSRFILRKIAISQSQKAEASST